MRRGRSLVIGIVAVMAFSVGAAAMMPQYNAVTIAPTKTSIYIGSVSMTVPTFVRHAGTYTSSYQAKVFPYFFYNEKGTIAIDFSDEQLRRLERGEPVEFEGRGMSSEREPRHIAGKATPATATTGKIKVRVFVSKKIQLIFNTTYRFDAP